NEIGLNLLMGAGLLGTCDRSIRTGPGRRAAQLGDRRLRGLPVCCGKLALACLALPGGPRALPRRAVPACSGRGLPMRCGELICGCGRGLRNVGACPECVGCWEGYSAWEFGAGGRGVEGVDAAARGRGGGVVAGAAAGALVRFGEDADVREFYRVGHEEP